MARLFRLVTVVWIAASHQPAAPAASHRVLLDQYCVRCHNRRTKTAGVTFDTLDLSRVADHAEIWEKAIRKVRAGMMPPSGRRRPDGAALDRFASFLEHTLDDAAAARPNPGRVPMHRLNRFEYANAIDDLLGLRIDASALLPRDPEAGGFDNIASALRVSPSFLDQYMTAALRNNPAYHTAEGALVGGSNMVAMHLTHYFGGDLALGLMSAVAFATILAVVAGVALAGAGAVVHDVYVRGLRGGRVAPATELKLSRIAVICFGALALVLGLVFENQNIAVITSSAMAIAASVNFPIIILSLYWRGLTTRGAVAGGVTSLVLTVVLTLAGPNVLVDVFGYDRAIFPYPYPTIVAMPIAFLTMWMVSIADRSDRARAERAQFEVIALRAELGVDVGIDEAAAAAEYRLA